MTSLTASAASQSRKATHPISKAATTVPPRVNPATFKALGRPRSPLGKTACVILAPPSWSIAASATCVRPSRVHDPSPRRARAERLTQQYGRGVTLCFRSNRRTRHSLVSAQHAHAICVRWTDPTLVPRAWAIARLSAGDSQRLTSFDAAKVRPPTPQRAMPLRRQLRRRFTTPGCTRQRRTTRRRVAPIRSRPARRLLPR